MENIKEWLKVESGQSVGDGYGSGSGYGDGYGSGSGSVYGDGYGSGSGSVYGDGSGSGSGSGYGYGFGFGYGDGYGSGYGDGDGIGSFNGKEVHMIDGIQTIIEHIKDAFARGFILNEDFTLSPCFIVKGHGYFAHGNTIKEAQEALTEKIFENMDPEESINAFVDRFKKCEKYPGTDFFEWHHYLTGSCLMGRKSFVRNHGLNVNDLYTVDEFITICENDYGSEVIRQLKERWKQLK